MPESRDRLSRPVDVAALFVRWRSSGVFNDSDAASNLFGSPMRQETAATIPTGRRLMGFGATHGGGFGTGSFGTPRTVNRRSRNGSSSVARETSVGTSRRGRGRSTNSVLPSWYPRTPLRDITAIVSVLISFLILHYVLFGLFQLNVDLVDF